jgi:hypothetical protein
MRGDHRPSCRRQSAGSPTACPSGRIGRRSAVGRVSRRHKPSSANDGPRFANPLSGLLGFIQSQVGEFHSHGLFRFECYRNGCQEREEGKGSLPGKSTITRRSSTIDDTCRRRNEGIWLFHSPTVIRMFPIHNTFSKEMVVIGRLLVDYGELELDLMNCVQVARNRDMNEPPPN